MAEMCYKKAASLSETAPSDVFDIMPRVYQSARAALIIKEATFSGWEIMGTWLARSSNLVAWIIFASARARATGTIRSSMPMRNQDGLVFQAAVVTLPVVAFTAQGICVA